MSDIVDGQLVVGWGAAARMAGRSVASVRKLVRRGRLHAQQNTEGHHVFRCVDLAALPAVPTASIATGALAPVGVASSCTSAIVPAEFGDPSPGNSEAPVALTTEAADPRLAELTNTVRVLRDELDAIKTTVRMQENWVTPQWKNDALAQRLGVVEQALVSAGLLRRIA
jgi:hypothetical protein